MRSSRVCPTSLSLTNRRVRTDSKTLINPRRSLAHQRVLSSAAPSGAIKSPLELPKSTPRYARARRTEDDIVPKRLNFIGKAKWKFGDGTRRAYRQRHGNRQRIYGKTGKRQNLLSRQLEIDGTLDDNRFRIESVHLE